MDSKHKTTSPPPLSTTLFSEIESQLQADLLQQDGLTPYLEALVKSPNDHTILLKPALFKHIRGTLKLYPHLPKPPSLAEFTFLLQKKGGSLLRESFEDNWTAGTLAYAAAAEVFVQLCKLVNAEAVSVQSPLFHAAKTSLLCASNVLARSIVQYRHQAERQANRHAARPGQERSRLLSIEDAKTIQASLDTQSKLLRTTQPKPHDRRQPFQTRRGRGRGRGRNNYWKQKFFNLRKQSDSSNGHNKHKPT